MKLKLSKKTGLTIGMVIFVAAAAFLFKNVSQNLDKREKLDTQLAALRTQSQAIRLEPLIAEQTQLEEQLNQVTPQLESAKAIISQSVNSTAATAALFQAARINDITVAEVTSSNLTDESLGIANLLGMPLSAKVIGNTSDLASFVAALNGLYVTGVVKSIEITIPAGSTADNASASIELVVYTYRGD